MMKYLQKLGKAMMLPVAALPICPKFPLELTYTRKS